MISFRDFVIEGGHVPVISTYKDQVDITKESTRSEINKNLALTTIQKFVSPYAGWAAISKTLRYYNITLPRVIFKDDMEGEEIVAILQCGDHWGASVDGKITSPEATDPPDYFIYYHYYFDDEGGYKVKACVIDHEGIENLPDEEVDTGMPDNIGKEGMKEPPQH